MFERDDEIAIVHLRLVVSSFAQLFLKQETLGLIDRIIEFAVTLADLASGDDRLELLDHLPSRGAFGERRHFNRKVDEKAGTGKFLARIFPKRVDRAHAVPPLLIVLDLEFLKLGFDL